MFSSGKSLFIDRFNPRTSLNAPASKEFLQAKLTEQGLLKKPRDFAIWRSKMEVLERLVEPLP